MKKLYDEREHKLKEGSIPDTIRKFLKHKKMHTKTQISRETKLKRSAVDRGCRILRKK